MRDIANSILAELDLDYQITLISGGESGDYEIVMWDRPRNSYFSCTAPGSLDTHLCYAAWRSSYSSRASIGV